MQIPEEHVRTLIYEPCTDRRFGSSSVHTDINNQSSSSHNSASLERKQVSSSRGSSPFPKLDQFIAEHAAKRSGEPGFIRSWAFFVGECNGSFEFAITSCALCSDGKSEGKAQCQDVICYNIGGNRYCDNVGESSFPMNPVSISHFPLSPECSVQVGRTSLTASI